MSECSLAYIGLGSNLNNPSQQIYDGLHALKTLPLCEDLQCANWYSSKAIGPGEQPNYINTVASLATTLSPIELLHQLQRIEDQQGRQRDIRWGARTLDLDLLLYDNIELQHKELTLPHPQMQERSFVLVPLHDIAPSLILPNGKSLAGLIKHCDISELQLVETRLALF